jgi:hypothetical protein
MRRAALRQHLLLVLESCIVESGSAPHAIDQCLSRESVHQHGRGRRVAYPHLPEDERIGAGARCTPDGLAPAL